MLKASSFKSVLGGSIVCLGIYIEIGFCLFWFGGRRRRVESLSGTSCLVTLVTHLLQVVIANSMSSESCCTSHLYK